jgi:hypothetical chaperone protein
VDFGTSNSGAAVMAGATPYAIPLEPGAQTLPSAIFVDFAARRHVYGTAAQTAMMRGEEGRFMRALKSVLGTSLAQEPRQFLNERLTLIEVIARFLSEIRARSEAATGLRFDAVLSGRPVRFHSEDAARDAQAEADLRAAYDLAGFADVHFLPEPEAAARAVAGQGRMLIVDIGGGTSDFTLCERDGEQTRVIASRGLRLGGTDFDRVLSLANVMPLLGHGAELRDTFGDKRHNAPRALFHDLASWEKIAFVYGAKLLREVESWIRLAEEPLLFERLAEVLRAHLGHDIAYAVEAGKIAANKGDTARIALEVVERGLSAPLTRAAMDAALLSHAERIGVTARETLDQAGVAASSVDRVVFVGGASLMQGVRHQIGHVLPDAQQDTAEVFTAVVHGLAIAAAS